MSLGNTVLQLSVVTIHGAYIVSFSVESIVLVLSEVCVQCPIWLFYVVSWLHVFSGILLTYYNNYYYLTILRGCVGKKNSSQV